MNHDTIVALATPAGRGGVAIIRISGDQVLVIAEKIIGKKLKPRYAMFCNFYGKEKEIIDQGIAIFFPNPHSFTGEDILELQIHGSPVVVNILTQTIISMGARLANPGEFSLRAFLNNRMDLVQAEAIADLIHASSQAAAKNALRSLQGVFSNEIQKILQELIQLRLFIEAEIDFTEEEIDFISHETIEAKIHAILLKLAKIKKTAKQGSLLAEGINVVIFGEPNVGKSSLLNALSQKDVAIVTDIPGTTRDVLREKITLEGLTLNLIDTAGLRESLDPIEQEGIRRAKLEIEKADLILVVLDANTIFDFDSFEKIPNIKYIFIKNKIDLSEKIANIIYQENYPIVSLSVKTGEGLSLLTDEIKNQFGLSQTQEDIFSARQRHLDALCKTENFLQQGLMHSLHLTRELLADDLRFAQNALNEITGEFTSDDLLGKIFSSFCIGK